MTLEPDQGRDPNHGSEPEHAGETHRARESDDRALESSTPASPAAAEPAVNATAPIEPSVRELPEAGPGPLTVPVTPIRSRPTLSPRAGLAGGGLLAVIGLVSLIVAFSGVIKPSQPTAAASPAASPAPPSPAIPLASPVIVTPADLANGRTLGLATAPVKVEVWEDFQCPICARWNATVKEQLITAYVKPGKIQLTYRDFIVIGRESILAAVAARIAERDGKFWPYADRLFANQIGENSGSFAPARLVAIAAAVHLDWQRFETALLNETEDPATIQVLQTNQDEGTKLGITGTPSIVVNGTLLQKNDWPTISAAIDKALAGK